MKKYFLWGILILGCFVLMGCNKEKNVLEDYNKKIEKLEGYNLEGELEIINNEDSYKYDVIVGFKKDNNFKVSLINKTNNHEQIILRNNDGVYVLTPSLNKSFKFDSVWPYNNSQIYLLQTILNDINNDENKTFEENENEYIFMSKVNYTNNKNLIKQKIIMDKNLDIKEVQILDDKDNLQMKMIFKKYDYNAIYNDDYFTLKGNMKATNATVSNTLNSIVYPMFLPENTHLTSQEKISIDNGERVIMTFDGDKPFMMVQETSKVYDELLTVPIYGEPHIITGTVGSMSNSSISWNNNGVDYYLVSEVLNQQELLEIANSISVKSVAKQ